MLIRLREVDGDLIWKADGFAPPHGALAVADDGGVEARTGWQHGRTAFLDGPGGETLCVKGVGWTRGWTRGWRPDMGSTGILPLRAAEWERDVALHLAGHGLACVRPLAIFRLDRIPGCDGGWIDADTVADLDGGPARPCVYYYRGETPLRCSEWNWLGERRDATLDATLRRLDLPDTEAYIRHLARTVAAGSGFLHAHGGHHYSASSHNVTLLGEWLDFEYTVIERRHWLEQLIRETDDRRDQELDGWLAMLSEVADALAPAIDRRALGQDFLRAYLEAGGDAGLPTALMLAASA